MSVEYSSHFSNDNFWGKTKKFCVKAGIKVIYTALLLFYTLQEPTVPAKAKAAVIGALGYFISPIDAIFDGTPVIGFTDDYGVLFVALTAVAMYINDDVKTKARGKLKDLFGNSIDLNEIMEIEKGFELNKTD